MAKWACAANLDSMPAAGWEAAYPPSSQKRTEQGMPAPARSTDRNQFSGDTSRPPAAEAMV